MTYTWIPFYKEFSQKLLQFRSDRKPLVNWLYDNLDSHVKHLKVGPNEDRLPDIDPFSVIAIINRSITYNKKISICAEFKNFLNISSAVPQDFSGVPEVNNLMSSFIGYGKDRRDGDIERLWIVFEDAVLDRDIKDDYDALNGQFVIKYNITMGLFWIRPDKYLALDGNNRENLKRLGVATLKGSRFVPYQEYKGIMDRLDAKILSGAIANCSNYAEFSHVAYKLNDGASTRDLPKDTSPKLSSSTKSYWTYSPGEQAVFWDEYFENGIMGLGWNKIGDLREYRKQEDLIAPLKENYGADTSQKNSADMLYSFAYEMKPGDIVFAKKGRSTIVGKGVVTSDYYYDENHKIQPHIRKVKWTDKGEWKADSMLAMKTLT